VAQPAYHADQPGMISVVTLTQAERKPLATLIFAP
jgi:hypothetical protein